MLRATPSILLLLVVVHGCASGFAPQSIGGGSESGVAVTDVTQRKSGSEYVALDKGRVGKAGSQGYDKDETGSQGHVEENGHYNDQDNNRKGYDVGHQSSGQAHSSDRGENNYEQRGAGEHKKGYHKSGFTNNYHKDESGNKATFYEDSEDERGHKGYDNRGGRYGQNAEDAFRDGRYDGAFNGRNKEQKGLYDNRNGYDNRRAHSGSFDDNQYYDDRRNFLQDGSGRTYDRNGNEVYYRREQQPYQNHGYYSSAPLVSGPLYSRDYLDAPPPRYYPKRREYRGSDYIHPDKGVTYGDSYIDGGGYRNGGGRRGGAGYNAAGYGGSYGSYDGGRYKKGYVPFDDGYRRSY